MKKIFQRAALVLLLLAALNCRFTAAFAQSTAFTYQGRVTDSGTNFTGTGQFEFALQVVTNTSSQAVVGIGSLSGINSGAVLSCVVYNGGSGYTTPPVVTFSGGSPDATGTAVVSNGAVTAINIISGGNYPYEALVSVAPPPVHDINFSIWENDGTSGSQPVSAVSLGVTNGLFTVVLGDSSRPNMTTIPETVFLQTNLWLQIWFNDGAHGWSALNPAQPLTATPFATFATVAGSLTGTLPTSQLTGTVPAANLSGSVPAASLTSVPAASLTGSIADGRLSANVALRAGGNTFSGDQILTNGFLGIGLTNPTYPLEVASNGVPKMTMDTSGNLECSGTVYSRGVALTSDRNAKENFQPLNRQALLAKVVALPVTQWNYKTDEAGVQHIGPMAQDFRAAFGLDGADDKHISVVDEGGVALAAIQALNQKLDEKDAQIKELEARLDKLEQTISQKNDTGQ